MNHTDTSKPEKRNGAFIGITGAVLGLVVFTVRKALSDKETRGKIIDTFFDVKKKLSDSAKNEKLENLK